MRFQGRELLARWMPVLILGTAVAAPLPARAKPGAKGNAQTRSGAGKTGKPAQPPGGANQVDGLRGKIGQMLFDGKWRFQVQDVQQVASYTLKVPASEQDYAKYRDAAETDADGHTFTAKAGYTFVAVTCLVKNGQNKVQQLDSYLNDPRTALTDDQGNSYPPIVFDMISKGAWITKPLLPGSGEPMTVLFAVPPGTKLKDLVFTLKNWSDSRGRDVRVSLVQ